MSRGLGLALCLALGVMLVQAQKAVQVRIHGVHPIDAGLYGLSGRDFSAAEALG